MLAFGKVWTPRSGVGKEKRRGFTVGALLEVKSVINILTIYADQRKNYYDRGHPQRIGTIK
jgi:hypothetical protein